ncbi:MAG TPA: CarD family transcriptional regulator [Lachnospiraceae bacterium]|nr:CarD family transcriptional regulator [Lachnospiraceae bacterium]
MFEVGDYIIYGSTGVCRVEKVGSIDLAGVPKGKLYYTLVPVYEKGSKVFTPTDNGKVAMRPVISKVEASKLINDIKNIELFWTSDDKRMENEYRESMKKCDCREYVRIIKTLYLRNQARIEEGKKVTVADKKYLDKAEECLYGELAIPLGIDKAEVEQFITTRINNIKGNAS